jgi:hypothetical protein
VWERINIAAYMLWMIVLSVQLLQRAKDKRLLMKAPGESFKGKIKSNGHTQPNIKHSI